MLQETAKNLLLNEEVDIVIGYAEGSEGLVRAHFARTVNSTGDFIYDERCIQNLAVYLVKGEVKKLGKMAVFANLSTIRSVLQVASENQLSEEDLLVLALEGSNEIKVLKTFEELKQYVASRDLGISEDDQKLLEKLDEMSREDRWQYWLNQFSKCIKCYACRATCPMCYCGRCQTDFNQPQLITVEATPLGNLEWHTMRAMHLAGRCVTCGDCGRACPVGIPIHLLTVKAAQTVKRSFDADAGTDAEMPSVMSTFEKDDKEDFIKYE